MNLKNFFLNPRFFFALAALSWLALFLDRVIGLALPDMLVIALSAAGAAFMLAGFLMLRGTQKNAADERFILHRLKSTRFATILGLTALLGVFLYFIVLEDVIHWELLIVMAVFASGKLAAMLYYRKTM